ncbi:MAG: mannose-1-phosphate guanylyltransferase [Thermoanaerobaculia bacterium]
MTERAAILMAGGAGTRLWPLSTEENPKQFLELFAGSSLLQLAWNRMRKFLSPSRIFVSTNERYRAKVSSQLREIPEENILVEPARRNTAPAIAICCREVARLMGHDPIIGIFPADQHIGDEAAFLASIETAYEFAADQPWLVTLGIDPDHPNTGFGYLELGEELAPGVIRLQRFVEKPSIARAEEFLRAGNFVWNAGMFVWRQSTFAATLAATAQEIDEIAGRWDPALPPRARREIYESMPAISIDFAVMEKAANVATVRSACGWSDVGSWKAVAALVPQAEAPEIHLEESDRVLVRSDGLRPVVVIGMRNVAVIDAPEGLLVLDLDRSESLSKIVKRL